MPSLIGSTNGRPKRSLVQKKSECTRCHAPLLAGHLCVEIPKLRGAFSKPKRFCDDCFIQIVGKTSDDLEEIKKL